MIVLKELALTGGIGRELYTSPFIWIPKERIELDSKGKVKDKFSVWQIGIKNKVITDLEIYNFKGVRVFNFKNGKQIKEAKQ